MPSTMARPFENFSTAILQKPFLQWRDLSNHISVARSLENISMMRPCIKNFPSDVNPQENILRSDYGFQAWEIHKSTFFVHTRKLSCSLTNLFQERDPTRKIFSSGATALKNFFSNAILIKHSFPVAPPCINFLSAATLLKKETCTVARLSQQKMIFSAVITEVP